MYVFFSGLFPSQCFLSISESTFRRLGLPYRGFRRESIAKIDFPRKSFFMNFGVDCYRFVEALGAAVLIFERGKQT